MIQEYYDTLGVSITDSMETIKKKYKKLAFKYHPDRNPHNKQSEEHFKKIGEAYSQIKKLKSMGNFDFHKDHSEFFKNYVDKVFNKGLDINSFLKEFDINSFLGKLKDSYSKIRFHYDSLFCSEKTDDIIVTIHVELSDIYYEEDKIINLVRNKKCLQCYDTDLKFCNVCNNKQYCEQDKAFVFNCADKLIIFSGESNDEKNKKAGDVIIKLSPKIHPHFSIINNYDLLYEINMNTKIDVNHEILLFKEILLFRASFPWRKEYILENKGLPIPLSNNRGSLIIKINYTDFQYSMDSNYTCN